MIVFRIKRYYYIDIFVKIIHTIYKDTRIWRIDSKNQTNRKDWYIKMFKIYLLSYKYNWSLN